MTSQDILNALGMSYFLVMLWHVCGFLVSGESYLDKFRPTKRAPDKGNDAPNEDTQK